MTVKLLTEYHLEFLSLKVGCTGSAESILVKMPHCWKSHVADQMLFSKQINALCIVRFTAESLMTERMKSLFQVSENIYPLTAEGALIKSFGKTVCGLFQELIGTIRIYHEYEGRIEKSVPWIVVWHHQACRVMTNGDPEGGIFLSYPHTNNGFLFLLTTVFIYLF